MLSSRWSIFIFGILCVLSSCKTRQQVVVTPTVIPAPIEQAIQLVVSNSAAYQSMRAPLGIKCQIGDRAINLSGQLSIDHDSLMSLSIRFFGMEVGKLMVGPERCLLINRVGRQYCDLSDKGGHVELGLKMMGYVLMNRLISSYPDDYTLVSSREIKWKHSLYAGDLSYQLSDSHRIESLSYRAADWNMSVDYSNFEKPIQGAITLPTNIVINGVYGTNKINMVISMSQVEVDVPINVNFSIPSGYQKVEAEDLLKLVLR